MILIYIVVKLVYIAISALQFLMLARAVMSWVMMDDDSTITRFLYAVTEPVIMPVRALIEKFGLFQGMPFDMSFLITMILLSIIEVLLPTVRI